MSLFVIYPPLAGKFFPAFGGGILEEFMVLLGQIGQEEEFMSMGYYPVNITVKDNPSHPLSPTWGLVREFKKGKIPWEVYREEYFFLVATRLKNLGASKFWGEVFRGFDPQKHKGIVFLCYCRDERRCHRGLAKEFLERLNEEGHLFIQRILRGEWEEEDEIEYLFSRDEYSFRDEELSPDGEYLYVETTPSSLPPHHRWGRRLERKFSLEKRNAFLMAYMVYAMLDGESLEVRKYFEDEISSKGFSLVFQDVKSLFFELLSCEPRDEVRSFLGEGHEFRALPLDTDKWERENPDPPKTEGERMADRLYESVIYKIKHLKRTEVSESGRKLYVWSRRPDIRELLGYDRISMIWSEFRKKKEQLASLR